MCLIRRTSNVCLHREKYQLDYFSKGSLLFSSILFNEFCRLILENKLLTFIGQNSIGFYFMHGALPITISMVALYIVKGSHYVLLFADLFVCLAVAYLAVMIIMKWLPWLFDLRLLRSKVDKS